MTHTAPDYTSRWKTNTVFGVLDVGELAARLGSPSMFDRRGNVLWFDNFEHAILQYKLDGEQNAVLSAETAFMGDTSCKLTTGATAGDVDEISKYLRYPQTSKIGLEVTFAIDNQDAILELMLDFYDGTNHYYPYIRYDATAETLEYAGPGVGYTEIADNITLWYDDITWYTMKLVFDLTEHVYSRAIFGDVDYPLAPAFPYHEGDGSNPFMQLQFQLNNSANTVCHAWIDNFILTQNE